MVKNFKFLRNVEYNIDDNTYHRYHSSGLLGDSSNSFLLCHVYEITVNYLSRATIRTILSVDHISLLLLPTLYRLFHDKQSFYNDNDITDIVLSAIRLIVDNEESISSYQNNTTPCDVEYETVLKIYEELNWNENG